MHRKVGSTTSDCAYFEINLYKREQYWHAEYLEGVSDESTQDVIDLDKSNYKLELQNQKYGKVIREKRCDARGKYKNVLELVGKIGGIIGDMLQFKNYFIHVGFPDN